MAKVLGMGNALVDIMIRIDDESLFDKFQLEKGGMRLTDAATVQHIMNDLKNLPAEKAPGGSAANTINGLANLGIEAGFIGKVAHDLNGKFMEEDMLNNNITPHLKVGVAPTGIAAALVTPDSERTFAVNLGCAIELVPEDITSEMFAGYDFFHIEGYLVQNHDLLRKAVEMAKINNVKVSLDLASFDVVRDHLGFLKEIIAEYVDIVFANEEEAKAYTGLEPREALEEIYKVCDVAVVKTGKNGSLIKIDDRIYEVGVINANAIDTTGAGDLYAAGFLYGLANGLSPDKCGRIGALLAGKVIEVMGAKMPKNTWQDIVKEVGSIKQN
jgi:sugar/nucleoside kinase (ribokinase family)